MNNQIQSIYEVPTEFKRLAIMGRKMMDMSEYANCKGMKDEDFKLLNDMSHVGNLLTKLGNTFGPTMKDFSQEDLALVGRFARGEIDIPQMKLEQ